jgi:hypothetical protein
MYTMFHEVAYFCSETHAEMALEIYLCRLSVISRLYVGNRLNKWKLGEIV